MRPFGFAGLLGLVGLVGGTLTPPLEGSVLAEGRLLVNAESHFHGVAYNVKATNNECVKLHWPVYKNLRSVQMRGKRCDFFGSDKCTGKALIMAKAPKDAWLRMQVDKVSHFASLIASVGCTDVAAGDASYTLAAPEKRDEDSKRLTVFAEDNFKGVHHELEATNRCAKLDPPVYKNVHSYGVVNQVCYFMDTDRCNGKVLITGSAKGTEVWGRVDVGGVNGDAARITSVYCRDLHVSDAVDTATATAHVNSRANGITAGVGDVHA
jgi:hypothetical protein